MFAIVIGSIRWPMVVLIGLVSAAYTAYGGLYVSIVTDQVRGVLPVGASPPTEVFDATGVDQTQALVIVFAEISASEGLQSTVTGQEQSNVISFCMPE